METRWQKIAPWRYPVQYWTNELLKYFNFFEFEELIEMKPRVVKILSKSIKYKYKGEKEEHTILKEEFKDYWKIKVDNRFRNGKPLGAILDYSESPFLHPFNLTFNINGKERTGIVWDDIVCIDLFDEVMEEIYKNNPHWKMNCLTEIQIENNIYDVLNSNFEKFAFTQAVDHHNQF